MTKTKRTVVNSIHITANMKAILVKVLDGGPIERDFFSSNQDALVEANLLRDDGDILLGLTEEGTKIAQEAKAAADARRKKANANARARNEALRSIGMVKTPYGWE